ncbi:MAG: hypothetical protein GY768_19740 [Planctomycetaceae bacterium]|nr:hypothetical protein [Planctomycetaceae bacterium]
MKMTWETSASRNAILLLLMPFLCLASAADAVAEGIEIANVERDDEVSFQNEILPVLRQKCLACHNQTDAEGDLVLETPASILQGGAEGPAVVPGDSQESLMLAVAAHLSEPIMPPEDNEADADNFSSAELGLLKLWIDQGAKADPDAVAKAIQWQPLPPGVNPVYSVAMSANGQFVAAGRANQVFLYRGQAELGRLSDDQLVQTQPTTKPGVAHLDMVQSLAFNPDGTRIASGGYRTVKIWQRVPALVSEQQLVEQAPSLVAISQDGMLLVFADTSGKLVAWRGDEQIADWMPHSTAVQAVAISPDGQHLASTAEDKVLKISALDGQAELGQVQLNGSAKAIVWIGNRIVVAGENSAIQIWQWEPDSKQLSLVGTLEGHAKPITAVAAVGQAGLLSASEDGSVRQWNLDSFKETRLLDHGGPVNCLAVSPDGSKCVTAGNESGTKIWKLSDGTEIATLTTNMRLNETHRRHRFEFEVAQRHVENSKKDLEAGEKRKKQEEENLKKVEETLKKTEEELKKKQEAAAKSEEAKKAVEKEHQTAIDEQTETQKAVEAAKATEAEEDDKEAAANLAKAKKSVEESKKKLDEATKNAKKAADELVTAERSLESSRRSLERAKTALADAGQALEPLKTTVTDSEQFVKTKEAEFKAAEKADQEFQLNANCLVMAADGAHFAVGSADGSLFVCQADDGTLQEQIEMGEGTPMALHFVDGTTLFSINANGAKQVWSSLPRWKLSHVIGSPEGDSPFQDRVTALAFSPDGNHLAVGGGEPSRIGELKLVSVEDGSILKELVDAHSDTVFGVAFSPDGQRLASCGADRFMKVFDLKTGELEKTFEGHTHHVLDVAWQADGRVLATAGADKVVKVWDFQNGSQIKTIQGFGKEVTALDFSGSTNRFFAACGDRSLYRCNTEGARDGIGKAQDFLYAVSSNRTGDTVVFAGHDSVVRMVNSDGKEPIEHAAP